jgi:hypothetical protein
MPGKCTGEQGRYCSHHTLGRFRGARDGPILGSMSGFVVDSRSLLAVRDTLGRLHGELLSIPNVVGGYDGLLGGRALESQLEQFCTSWQFGILQVADRIEAMMERLLQAAAAYERIEHRISSSGHRLHHPGSGSGTTVIGGGPSPGSGSGTTVIGDGPSPGSGSGTTTIG